MKAQELRIGNLILNEVGQVVEVCATRIRFLQDKKVDYKPIALAEEWLLKMGFRQNRDKWFEINYFTDCNESAEKMGVLINLTSNRCAILDTDTDEQCAMTAKGIHHVHQLQNLYFALTGCELEIK